MPDQSLGKKVFFLYPPSVVQEDVITRLLDQEFEVYTIRNHDTALSILQTYPDSIIFVNIDAVLSESKWIEWIRCVRNNPVAAQSSIGILTYNADERLQRKYLIDIGIQCGFIRLKLGAEESTKILIMTLNAAEAKGRRKYVRVCCERDSLATLNIREGLTEATGSINDISVVGFSCTFNPDPCFKKNTLLRDVQLRLRGNLINTEVIVFGTRQDDQLHYVMLFTAQLESLSRQKIRQYIRNALQQEIEQCELPPVESFPRNDKQAVAAAGAALTIDIPPPESL